VSVERIGGAGPDHELPAGARIGVIWAAKEDLSSIGAFLVYPGGLHQFAPGPDVSPGVDVTPWCMGVLGILERHELIDEIDYVPLLELARDFYAPRGLWHTGCVTR
jgi:hypothetical protein